MSPDPLGPTVGDPRTVNPYMYAVNNPLGYTDPTGLLPCPGCNWVKEQITTGAGFVWGGASQYVISPAQRALFSGASGIYSVVGPTAVFISDYISDKAQDIALYAALAKSSPQSIGQNTVALGISLGSTGDRRTGEGGFVAYENCRLLCEVMAPFLGENEAYAPGFIAFGMDAISDSTFRHENQHHIHSQLLGPAYLPVTFGFYIAVGHDASPLERDADKARTEGVHFPFVP